MEFRELTLSDPVSIVDCGVAGSNGVFCARDGTIVERTPSGDTLRTLASNKRDSVTCMALVSGKELRLWAGMTSGYVKVYAVEKLADEAGPAAGNTPAVCRAECLGHSAPVTCIVSHGRRVYTGSADKCVFEWHADTMDIVRALPCQRGIVRATAGIGMALFTADSADAAIRCWNLGTCKPAGKLTGHASPVRTIMYHMLNGTLWTGGEDGNILVWDVSEQEILATLRTHTHAVTALTQSSTGFVFSAGEDNLLCIYTSVTPFTPQCVKVVSIPNLTEVVPVKEEAGRVELWVVRRGLGIRAVQIIGRSPVGGMPDAAARPESAKKAAANRGRAPVARANGGASGKLSLPRPTTKRSATPTQPPRQSVVNTGKRRQSPSPGPVGRVSVRRASPSPVTRGPIRKASPSPVGRGPIRKASPSPVGRRPSPSPAGASRSDSYTKASTAKKEPKKSAETLALIEENKMLRRQLLQAQAELAGEKTSHETELRINQDREAFVQATLFQTTNSIADMISLVKRTATHHPELKYEMRDLLQCSLAAHKTLMDFKQPARPTRISRSPLRQRRGVRSSSPAAQSRPTASPHRRKSPRPKGDDETASLLSCDDRMPLKRGAWYATRESDAAAVATGQYSEHGRVGLPVAVETLETDEVYTMPAHAPPPAREEPRDEAPAVEEVPAEEAQSVEEVAPREAADDGKYVTLSEEPEPQRGWKSSPPPAEDDAEPEPAPSAPAQHASEPVYTLPEEPAEGVAAEAPPTASPTARSNGSSRPSRLAAMLDDLGGDISKEDSDGGGADPYAAGTGDADNVVSRALSACDSNATNPALELSLMSVPDARPY